MDYFSVMPCSSLFCLLNVELFVIVVSFIVQMCPVSRLILFTIRLQLWMYKSYCKTYYREDSICNKTLYISYTFDFIALICVCILYVHHFVCNTRCSYFVYLFIVRWEGWNFIATDLRSIYIDTRVSHSHSLSYLYI